jgi:hypothetical protein
MDDLRIGSLGPMAWYPGQPGDQSKRRSRHGHAEMEDDPSDRVVLSTGEAGEALKEDAPAGSDDVGV